MHGMCFDLSLKHRYIDTPIHEPTGGLSESAAVGVTECRGKIKKQVWLNYDTPIRRHPDTYAGGLDL